MPSKKTVRIALITPVETIAKRWQALATQLNFQLTVLPIFSEGSIGDEYTVFIWHDVAKVGVVPKTLTQYHPIWLLDTERASKPLEKELPTGFQRADYHLVEPFTAEELQFILAARE